MANEENLKPFVKGDERCFRGGRPKGSKNLSTILRQVLSMDAPENIQKKKNLRGLVGVADGEKMTNAEVIAAQMVLRAVSNGDLSFINQIIDRTEGKAIQKSQFEATVTSNIPNEIKEGIMIAYGDAAKELADGDGDDGSVNAERLH
jgi:hypothetical protein